MRTFFLLLFISLNSFAQSKQALQKQLDSLKRIHVQVTINLSELQKKIDVAQSRLDLVTAKELSLGFQPIRLTLKGVVLFRDKNGTTKEYIPTGSVIDIIGYSEGNAKVLYKGKNGYISAVQFEEYAEVY
ncbi:hypothetical protein ACFQ1A_29370, partial [Massilia pinisoli]|uniref:hypothetical protein n=1 Tax=Massilia pinisoli TaxID=1772194 RepID=UPI00363A18B4